MNDSPNNESTERNHALPKFLGDFAFFTAWRESFLMAQV
jgi:hypothetical protein